MFFLWKIYREFSSEFVPWKCLLKIFFSLWPKFLSSLSSAEKSVKIPEKVSKDLKIGVAQTVFLVPCERGRSDENGENGEFAFYPLKTRASLLRPPKMTKIAGVTQAKAWFRKSRFCPSLKRGQFLDFFGYYRGLLCRPPKRPFFRKAKGT